MAHIHEYRKYLATKCPIAEIETHFLDLSDDLVCLGEFSESSDYKGTAPTPIPRRSSMQANRPCQRDPLGESYAVPRNNDRAYKNDPLTKIFVAVVFAVPTLTLIYNAIWGNLNVISLAVLVGSNILGLFLFGGFS
jgi:hypothetical protein